MNRGEAIAGLIVLGLVLAAFIAGIVLDIRYRVRK